MVSKAMCELPQGRHDSLGVFIFQIKASDEEACSIITGSSTATLWEIRVTRVTGKWNMSPRGLNIPLVCKCNLVWRVYHDALRAREKIIHSGLDWVDSWRAEEKKPIVLHCYTITQRMKNIGFKRKLFLVTLIIRLKNQNGSLFHVDDKTSRSILLLFSLFTRDLWGQQQF